MRSSQFLTGIVAAAYLLAVTPIEFLARYSFIAGTAGIGWLVLLNLGPYLQAGVALASLITLRAYFRARPSSVAGKGQTAGRLVLAAAGAVTGLIVALAWWELVHFACRSAGEESCVFDLMTSHGNYYVGTVADALAYYRYFALPCALLSGAISTHLVFGWPGKKSLFSWVPPSADRYGFIWFGVVLWLFLYRMFQLALTWVSASATSLDDSLFLNLASLVGTSFVCAIVSFGLGCHIPGTRRSSILICQAASLLILILSGILLLPLGWASAVAVQSAIVTLNIGGFVWGWIMGDLRWRSLQLNNAPPK